MIMLDSMEEDLNKVKRKQLIQELEGNRFYDWVALKGWGQGKILSTMSALMVCFNFLGPSVNMLNYWHAIAVKKLKWKLLRRKLPPIEEIFPEAFLHCSQHFSCGIVNSSGFLSFNETPGTSFLLKTNSSLSCFMILLYYGSPKQHTFTFYNYKGVTNLRC